MPRVDDLAAAQRFWLARPATVVRQRAGDSPLAGAIDMALLDIVGKVAKAPVYRLLGDPRAARRGLSLPPRSGRGGEARHRGRVPRRGVRVPAPAARNQGQAYQVELRKLVETVRSQAADFVLEGEGLLTPGDAASVAAAIQSLHPLWFDEPTTIGSLETLRKIADESVAPLGFGGTFVMRGFFRTSCAPVRWTWRGPTSCTSGSPVAPDRGSGRDLLRGRGSTPRRGTHRDGRRAASRRQPAELLHPAHSAPRGRGGPRHARGNWRAAILKGEGRICLAPQRTGAGRHGERSGSGEIPCSVEDFWRWADPAWLGRHAAGDGPRTCAAVRCSSAGREQRL